MLIYVSSPYNICILSAVVSQRKEAGYLRMVHENGAT